MSRPQRPDDRVQRVTLASEAEAPSFEYNPSSWRQRLPIAALALFAAAISLYMGLFQWGLVDSVWDPLFGDGTETVLRSAESERMMHLIGVPDAVLGSWAYLTEVMLTFAGSTRRWQFRPWLVLLFGIDVIPLGVVSIVLVVIQGVSVGAWCFLCLVTAAVSVALIVLAYDEVWACLRYLGALWRKHRDLGLMWKTFWGSASDRAGAVARDVAREGARARRGAVR